MAPVSRKALVWISRQTDSRHRKQYTYFLDDVEAFFGLRVSGRQPAPHGLPVALTGVYGALRYRRTDVVAGSQRRTRAPALGQIGHRRTERARGRCARRDRRRSAHPAGSRQRGGGLTECRSGRGPALGHRQHAERCRPTGTRGHRGVSDSGGAQGACPRTHAAAQCRSKRSESLAEGAGCRAK